MFFHKAPWITGTFQSLETFRKSQTGALLMGIFVASDTDEIVHLKSYLQTLRILNELMWATVLKAIIIKPYAAIGYIDYYYAVI